MTSVDGESGARRVDVFFSSLGVLGPALFIGLNTIVWLTWILGDWNYVPNQRLVVLAWSLPSIGIPIFTAVSIFTWRTRMAKGTCANRALTASLVAFFVTIPFLVVGATFISV